MGEECRNDRQTVSRLSKVNRPRLPSTCGASGKGKAFQLRVAVVQIGSRRNYAVPIALEESDSLHSLYTDWYAPKDVFTRVVGRLARWIPRRSFLRAAARQATEIDPSKVVHFPSFALQYLWKKRVARSRGESPRAYLWGGEAFCRRVLKTGIPSCDAVFCFSSVAKEIFKHLDGTGTLRVLDQGIPPLAFEDRLVREQEAVYAAWGKPRPVSVGVEEYAQRQREEWAVSDLILCPSNFCRGAALSEGAPEHKIRLLPFGIHPSFFSGTTNREPRKELRVLFAANTPIRKGLPDLVLALEKLNSAEIRGLFAGEVTSLTPFAISRARRVGEVLGNVPRPKMTHLYQDADVFVLPTVSDTFGAVILEAMAAGLPVITTPNCGSADVVRDGVDGFIVPVRSPEQIAAKLELLARDSDLRLEMGRNAFERAKEYTIAAYRERLTEVLNQAVCQSGDRNGVSESFYRGKAENVGQ